MQLLNQKTSDTVESRIRVPVLDLELEVAVRRVLQNKTKNSVENITYVAMENSQINYNTAATEQFTYTKHDQCSWSLTTNTYIKDDDL